MAGKNIVTSTVNEVSFRLDRNSYDRALKSIRKIKDAWTDANKAFNKNNSVSKASQAMQSAARVAQTSYAMVAKKQRDEAKKTADFIIAQNNRVSKGLTGMVGKAGFYDPNKVNRQNDQMNPKKVVRQPRVTPEAKAAAKAEALRNSRTNAQSIADVRLRAKYGSSYASKLGGGLNGIKQLNAELNAGVISVGRYRAGISALETQFRRSNAGAKGLMGSLKDMRSSFVQATAAYTAFSAAKGIMQTGQAFQGINAGLAMTSNGALDAQQKLEFLRKESMRLGLDLKSASQAYMKLTVSSRGKITSDQTNQLFTGVSELSTAMGLDTESQSGAIYAIQQMLSKGKVSSEELNQQLAERLPGSVQIFVEALQKLRKNTKLTETDLYAEMKAGKLLAKDILPLVGEAMSEAARRGGALDMMLKGNGVAMRRLAATWQNAQNIIFQSGFGDALTDLFNNLAENISNNSPLFSGIGRFFSGVVEFGKDMFNGLSDFFILTDAVITHYSTKWGVDMAGALNWAGYAAGFVAVIASLNTTFRILSWITGLRTGLTLIAGAVSAIGAAGTAASTGGLASLAMGLGRLGIGGAVVAGAYGFANYVDQNSGPKSQLSDNGQYYKDSWVGQGVDFTKSLFTPSQTPNIPNSPISSFNPYAMNNMSSQGVTAKVDPITINLQLKADTLRDLIEASVEDNNVKQINLLMQDGN